MIHFNNLIKDKELEKASENLPNEVHVIGYVENSKHNKNYNFVLIGRNAENQIKVEDIIYFKFEDSTKYANRIDVISYYSRDYMDNFCLYLDKIPNHIQYIDLYLMRDGDCNVLLEHMLRFQSRWNEDLFTYYTVTSGEHCNLLCGTFAKVSDGWKFYPKFAEHSINFDKLDIFYH